MYCFTLTTSCIPSICPVQTVQEITNGLYVELHARDRLAKTRAVANARLLGCCAQVASVVPTSDHAAIA